MDLGAEVRSSGQLVMRLGRHVNLKAALCITCSSVRVNLLCATNSTFTWASDLHCLNCFTSWTICSECPNHRTKMTKKFMMNKHNKVYHKTPTLSPDVLAEATQGDVPVGEGAEGYALSPLECYHDDVGDVTFETPCVSELEVECTSTSLVLKDDCSDAERCVALQSECRTIISYGNSISGTFFEHEKKGVGGGATYLVTRAITETPLVVSEILHPNDVGYHLKVANFINNLTRLQRQQFASIMSETLRLSKEMSVDFTNYLPTSFPSTPKFIDSVYIRGKCSLLENLPIPSVTVTDNHGYVSLLDIVAHLMSLYDGFSMNKEDTMQALPSEVTNITDSAAVNAIRGRARMICGSDHIIVLYCTEWSDDFDPSLSTKCNRQSCWIKTVTIMSCNSNDNIDKSCTTFPIAVGKKGSSHEAIEQRFAEELKTLRSGNCSMYSKCSGSVVPIYLELLVSLQDQPERRGMNYLMLGSGKYSARWGYSCNISEFAEALPTCSSCSALIMSQEHNYDYVLPSCTNCTNWDTCVDTPLLWTTPPSKYPKEALTTVNYLVPFKLSYSALQGAVTEAHNNIVGSIWSTEEARQYLWIFGINKEATSQVIEHALNVRMFNFTEQHMATMQREYTILSLHKSKCPNKYNQWAFPATWSRGVELEQHVDVPMHMLFLGVTKTSVKRVMEWTKQKNKHTYFLRIANGVLEAVVKLHLDWCHAIPMNGMNFGGWVSENYLALARLCRWYFSMLPFLRSGPQYVDPERPHTTWSAKELRDWLSIRGYSSKGKKMELMEKVTHLLSLDVVPPILPPKGGSVDDVVTLTHALGVTMATVMQRRVTTDVIARAQHYIKKFLSCYHDVDKHLLNEGDKPGWLTSYNFMCLLNIPNIMRQYGPISNLWEGGYDGEKYSQELKHRLRGGLKDNWHRNLLENVLADDILKRIKPPPVQLEHCTVKVSTEKRYIKYNSLDKFLHEYMKRKPLSVVRLSHGQWGAVIGKDSNILTVQFEPYQGYINGMHYWSIKVVTDEQQATHEEKDITHHCVLLPKLTEKGLPRQTEDPIYCVIESTWMDVVPNSNEEPVIDLPKM